MNKTTFYVVTVSNGFQRYSYAFKVPNSVNLWSILEDLSACRDCRIETLNACDTKSHAVDTARNWNQAWADKECLWLHAPILARVVWG